MSLIRQFRFSWPASTAPDPVEYEGEYRVDAGAWTSLFVLQPETSYAWDTVDLAAGEYEVRVRAYDGFGYGSWVVSAVFAVHLYGLVVFRLRIRNADDDGDELVISSLPGEERLCIRSIPQGDGQEFNPLTGESTVGAWLVEAVDRFLADDTTWAVTEKVFDAEARQQLLSRKAFLEISYDTGATWEGLVTGFVNSFELVGGLTWTFAIGEARRQDREKRLFESVTAAFGNITSLIGGPSREWWGPLYNFPNYWVFQVVALAADTVTLQMVDGWALDDANFGGRMGRHLTIAGIYARERANELALPELVRTDGVALSGRYPGIDVELTGTGGGTFTPTAQLGTDGLPELINGRGEIVLEWSASQPLVGDEFAVRGWRKKVSPDNPLHYRGHPVDLLTDAWTELGLAFDAAAATTVRAELGPDLAVLLRLTRSYTPEEMELRLGGLLGFAVRRNTDGERQLFRSRVRNITTPATTVTLDELRAVETPVFRADEALLCNSVVIRQMRFVRWSANQPDARPADDVLEIPLEFGPFDNGETDAYGEHQQVYELPGVVIASASGIEYGSGFFENGLAEELFDRFGRGGQVAVLEVTRDVAEGLGEEIQLTLPHLPVGGARGGTRCMQIVKRTPVVGGAVLRVLDTGEDAQPATNPTFTLAQSAVDPRKYGELEITNAAALNAAGIRVRVEWGFGSVEPDGGALLTEYAAGAIPTAAITLPPLDAGTHIWVRLQSFQVEKRAGPFTDWDDVALDALQPPSDIVFTPGATGDDFVDVSFVPVEIDMPHELYVRVQGTDPDTAVLLALLPAGSSAYIGIPVDLSTTYTFGVRAVELAPWQGVSTLREEDFAVGATPSDLDPPVLDDLAQVENLVNLFMNFDGLGSNKGQPGYSSWRIHPVASASGFAVSAPIEIWLSQETFPGSGIFSAYALHYPTTPTLPATTYPYPPTNPDVGRSISGWTVTPYDASLLRVKCRHAIPGGAVSAFSAEQEFTRELDLPAPPEFVGGLDPSTSGPGVLYQAAAGAPILSETEVSPVRGGTGSDLSATGPGLLIQATAGAVVTVGFALPAGTYTWTSPSILRPASDNAAGNTIGDATHRWYDVQAITATFGGLVTAQAGVTITAGQTLAWSSDNAAGSFIGTSASAGRPKAGYFGDLLQVGATLALTGIPAGTPGLSVRQSAGTNAVTFLGDVTTLKLGAAAAFAAFRVNGTEGAETGVLSGETIVNITVGGWHSGGSIATGAGLIYFSALENWTGTAQGIAIGASVRQTGTTTRRDTWLTRYDGLTNESWGAFTTATAIGTVRQDNIFMRDRASTAGSGNFGQGLAASRLSDATPRRVASMTTRQTTADPDQVGWTFHVHDSATDTTAMSQFADFSVAGDLKSRWYGDITWNADNAFDLGATGTRTRTVYGYTGDFTTGVIAGTGTFSGDITTSSDDITVGFGATTGNTNARMGINAGTNAGANDKDASIAWQRGGTSYWLAGVLGATFGTNTNWTLWDDVNNNAVLSISPISATYAPVELTGPLSLDSIHEATANGDRGTSVYGNNTMSNTGGYTGTDFISFYAIPGANSGTLSVVYGFKSFLAGVTATTKWDFYGDGNSHFGGITATALPAFAAGDKYVVITAAGVMHVSALGPAS